jgi:hypothetical protein
VLPLRQLDGFVIHYPGDRGAAVQLEHLQGTHPRAVASGTLLAPGEGAAGGRAGGRAAPRLAGSGGRIDRPCCGRPSSPARAQPCAPPTACAAAAGGDRTPRAPAPPTPLNATRRATAGGQRVEVTTGAIYDWVLDLGEHAGIWIVTDAAWWAAAGRLGGRCAGRAVSVRVSPWPASSAAVRGRPLKQPRGASAARPARWLAAGQPRSLHRSSLPKPHALRLPGRYRLGAPSGAYAPAYAPMRRRLDIMLRALRCLREEPGAAPAAAQDKILSGAAPGTTAARYSINALDGEAAFLTRQLEAMHKVRQGGLACAGSLRGGVTRRAAARGPEANAPLTLWSLGTSIWTRAHSVRLPHPDRRPECLPSQARRPARCRPLSFSSSRPRSRLRARRRRRRRRPRQWSSRRSPTRSGRPRMRMRRVRTGPRCRLLTHAMRTHQQLREEAVVNRFPPSAPLHHAAALRRMADPLRPQQWRAPQTTTARLQRCAAWGCPWTWWTASCACASRPLECWCAAPGVAAGWPLAFRCLLALARRRCSDLERVRRR